MKGASITKTRHTKLTRLLGQEFKVGWEDIKGGRRTANVVAARRYYFYIMRYIFYYTLNYIGKVTNKHHATVIHNIKTHEVYMELYPSERKRYNKIKKIMLEKESKKEIKERIEFLEEQKSIIQKKIDELLMSRKRINEILTGK